MKVADLFAEKRGITIVINGDPLNVFYRPAIMTPVMMESVQKIGQQPQEQIDALVEFLFLILAEWDLIGDDGAPYPVTHASLGLLPIAFLVRVMQAVVKDMSAGSEAPKASAAG